MINEEDRSERYFNLEEKITIVSNNRKNNFFVVCFDCCREVIRAENTAMRGAFNEATPE